MATSDKRALQRVKNEFDVEKNAHVIDRNKAKKPLPHVGKTPLWSIIWDKVHSGEDANYEVVVGRKRFKCHVFVLNCFTKYFRDKTREDSVTLDSNLISPENFEHVYKWMKTSGKVVENQYILGMALASEYLDIPLLKKQYTNIIKTSNDFAEDKAHKLIKEAQKVQMKSVILLSLGRIKKCFLCFVASDEFLNLDSKELAHILSFDDIWVTCELQILMSVVRWLIYDFDNRMKDIKEVVQNVRFELLTRLQVTLIRVSKDVPEIRKLFLDDDFDDIFSTRTKILYASQNPKATRQLIPVLSIQNTEITVKPRVWMDDYAWQELGNVLPSKYFSYTVFHKYLVFLELEKSHWQTFEKTKPLEESANKPK